MDVLQRDEIGQAVELVVRGMEIVEGAVFLVGRIVVAAGVVVFHPEARSEGAVRERVARAKIDGERLVAQALSRPGLDSAIEDAPETEACQRLLVSWKRLIEDNLFTSGPA